MRCFCFPKKQKNSSELNARPATPGITGSVPLRRSSRSSAFSTTVIPPSELSVVEGSSPGAQLLSPTVATSGSRVLASHTPGTNGFAPRFIYPPFRREFWLINYIRISQNPSGPKNVALKFKLPCSCPASQLINYISIIESGTTVLASSLSDPAPAGIDVTQRSLYPYRRRDSWLTSQYSTTTKQPGTPGSVPPVPNSATANKRIDKRFLCT